VGGYCCWPGQTFDVQLDRCSGPPSCPAGFVGVGSGCEISAGQSIDVRTEDAPNRSAPTSGRERDAGLLGGGAALCFVHYLGAVFTHFGVASSDFLTLWPLTFFPVVHNLAMIDNRGGTSVAIAWGVGFLCGAAEIAGLVMMIVGDVGHVRREARPAAVTWRVTGGPSGADFGWGVRASF